MLGLTITLLFAYLLGSVSTSVWLGKWFRGVDLREHGSRNPGTSNAFRVLGRPIGIIVLFIDVLKGYLAVNLSFFQDLVNPGSEGWIVLRIALGLLAVTGHIFPLFARFHGGKGVATLAGVGLAIHPFAALASLGIYLVILIVFKISSVGSISAAISYPFWMVFIFKSEFYSLWIFSICSAILLLLTHRSNIRRILRGEEKALFRK